MQLIDVTELTDPCCSYAWGTEPKVRRLQWCYGDHLRWRRVMCGISATGWWQRHGSEQQAPELRQKLSDYWKDVTALTGQPYPTTVHRVHDGSEDACRAVKAAERQGRDQADRLLRRMRETWFIFGRPASTFELAVELARGVPGLDAERLARDLKETATEEAYQADWEESRNPNDHVLNLEDDRVGFGKAREHNGRMRYGLPCHVFSGPAGEVTVAGLKEWEDWEAALEAVAPGITAQARPLPTPEEVFATWPLVTGPELALLCGPGAQPPAGVVTHDWGDGVVWLTPEEAAGRLGS